MLANEIYGPKGQVHVPRQSPAKREFDSQYVRYNNRVPKRPCTQRAEWRLTPGKPAERLPGHYQLDCDYGTALITIYKESDSIEPIYLCENHAKEVGGPAKSASGSAPAARATETKRPAKDANRAKIEVRARNENQTNSENQIKSDSQIKIENQTTIEAQTKIETHTKIETKTKGEERIQPVEVGGTKPNDSVPPEVKSSGMPAKPGGSTKDPVVRAPARDLAYGSSAKALVDEAIWNLASGDYEIYRAALRQGKTTIEAAQAAGGQLAIIHRKIGECALTVEALLSESKAKINAVEVIHKPLEHAMLEIIGNGAMGEAEKDAAIEELETLQESFSRGLHQEITPLEAHRIACAIGERAKWGASAGLSEELKPAYRALYSNVRNAIAAAVPDAVNIVERLANLYAAKADIENTLQPKVSHHADSVSIIS